MADMNQVKARRKDYEGLSTLELKTQQNAWDKHTPDFLAICQILDEREAEDAKLARDEANRETNRRHEEQLTETRKANLMAKYAIRIAFVSLVIAALALGLQLYGLIPQSGSPSPVAQEPVSKSPSPDYALPVSGLEHGTNLQTMPKEVKPNTSNEITQPAPEKHTAAPEQQPPPPKTP